MTSSGLVSSREAARRLGCSHRTVIRLVERGELEPSVKVPGYRGAYLFDPDHVRALADDRQGKKATP